jgi:exodeoxyribonuclease VII large subunit
MRAQLDALSPRATLDRGYAIVRKGEAVVRAAAEVNGGDAISVLVADGSFGARVE